MWKKLMQRTKFVCFYLPSFCMDATFLGGRILELGTHLNFSTLFQYSVERFRVCRNPVTYITKQYYAKSHLRVLFVDHTNGILATLTRMLLARCCETHPSVVELLHASHPLLAVSAAAQHHHWHYLNDKPALRAR